MGCELNKSEVLKSWEYELILHSSFTPGLGLNNGKMVCVLFFYHYSQYTHNPLYESYAIELLDEICADLSEFISIDFMNGLCGIGWGIEYLLQKGYIEGNGDFILQDIDRKIMERDPAYIKDYSFETGLEGIWCYVKTRLNSSRSINDSPPFGEMYLMNLEKACKNASLALSNEYDCSLDIILTKTLRNREKTGCALRDYNWLYAFNLLLAIDSSEEASEE